MMDTMDGSTEYYGSLVSFEGPQDIVSAQLRLLPNSPKTLVLPPVECVADESDEAGPFDARALILAIHTAYNARAEMARSFLKESTVDDRRLVFMNGGAATAYTNCIAAISKHETNGDIARAETIFQELLQNGVADLEPRSRPELEVDAIPEIAELEATEVGLNGDSYAALDDPSSNAMRAANALDLETASLQSHHVLDLTYKARPLRPRSTSVPNLPVTDDVHDLKKHPLPSLIRQSQILKIEKWRSTAAREAQLTDPNSVVRWSRCAGDIDSAGPATPNDEILWSGHGSAAVVGKALLVDLRPLSTHRHALAPNPRDHGAPRNRDMRLSNITLSALTAPVELADTSAMAEKTDCPSSPPLRSRFSGENAASAPLVKPKERSRRGPPLRLSTDGPKLSTMHVAQLSAVEGGRSAVLESARPESPETEAGNSGSFLYLEEEEDVELETDESFRNFQAVLPMIEDMIIYFKGEESEPHLEAMIQAFRNGIYPITAQPHSQPQPQPESREQIQGPTSPSSPPRSRASTRKPGDGDEEDDDGAMAVRDRRRGRVLTTPPTTSYPPKQGAVAPTHIAPAPPTPAQTPPPPTTDTPSGTAIHDFNVAGYKTAVSIQNSLRTLLSNHFPSEGHGYQFSFPLLPGLNGFWRPVFRENNSGNFGAQRKVDLILAVGTQQGVRRDLFNSVSNALMKLGAEPNGQSRSAKLDLRYLVANAMQAFTAQRLTRQAHGNPFSNPEQLATMMVPHLEIYLAAHSTTRFLLLEYPAEHLSTVLALQQVVGADLLKVAGIVDERQRNYMGYHHQQTRERGNSTGSASSSQVLFSKVNYMLASSASQGEIAKFIANIWGILIGISPVYAPAGPSSASGNPPRRNRYGSRDYSSPMLPIWDQYPPLAEAAVMLGFAPSVAEIEQQQRQEEEEEEERLQHQLRQLQQQKRRYQPPNYVSTGTHTDMPFPPAPAPTLNPPSPKSLRVPSSLPSLTLSPTSPTSATSATFRSPLTPSSVDPEPTQSLAADSMAAQQNVRRRAKLQNLLGRDVVAAALKGTAAADDDDGTTAHSRHHHLSVRNTSGRTGRGGNHNNTESSDYYDDDDEEDDDDDDEDYDNDAERKYMPLWKKQMQMQQQQQKKRSFFGRRRRGADTTNAGGDHNVPAYTINGDVPLPLQREGSLKEGSIKARKWLGLSN